MVRAQLDVFGSRILWQGIIACGGAADELPGEPGDPGGGEIPPW